jgi:hypothetical protein
MTAVAIEPVSYSYETAAAATGYSQDVLQRAVRAGDLAVRYPRVNGRALSKPVIEREELARWVNEGSPDRPSP